MGQPRSVSNTSPVTINGLAAATVVKNGPGWVHSVSVTTTGPCVLSDTNLVGGGTTGTGGNFMVTTPTAVGVTQVNMKFNLGLLVTPTGTASVTFE